MFYYHWPFDYIGIANIFCIGPASPIENGRYDFSKGRSALHTNCMKLAQFKVLSIHFSGRSNLYEITILKIMYATLT